LVCTKSRQWLEAWSNTYAQTDFAIGIWFLFKAYNQQFAYDHSISQDTTFPNPEMQIGSDSSNLYT
jgi:hypothetical protein